MEIVSERICVAHTRRGDESGFVVLDVSSLSLATWISFSRNTADHRPGNCLCRRTTALSKEVDPAGHTHAFDMYCAPFHQGQVNIWDRFQTDVVALFKSLDGTLTGLYLLTVLIGFGLQRFDPNLTLEAKLLSVQPTTNKGFDVVLPGWALVRQF